MSYNFAAHLFRQNLTLRGDEKNDPVQWNLYTGLAQLTEQLQQDIQQMQQMLREIDSYAKRIR